MNWFEKVKKYYEAGYYKNEQVKIFVVSEKITIEQYKKITNEGYIA